MQISYCLMNYGHICMHFQNRNLDIRESQVKNSFHFADILESLVITEGISFYHAMNQKIL